MRKAALVSGIAIALVALPLAAFAAGDDTALERVLAVEYDQNNEIFVAVGKSTSGDIDVWTGANKSWSKLQENRDIDNRYSPTQFADFAIGLPSGKYGVAVGNVDGEGTSINAREFYDKPWFGDGAPTQIGSLVRVYAVEYDEDNEIFVAVGKNAGNEIDVYIGTHNDWTQLQENRDIDNRYSPSEFVGLAIGLPGKYGVAVGNKGGVGTSINAREFSDKPYFGDGSPRQIGSLVEVYAVEYDQNNNIFVVVGKGPGGDIDVYTGFHNDWTKLQENRDIDNRYSPSEFVGFAIGLPSGKYGVAVGNVDDYKIAFRTYEPRGTSISAREFYDKPYFGDGKPEVIGD